MFRALFAKILFGHDSIESFSREQQRNPSLMLACCLALRSNLKGPHRYQALSKSAFSRFYQQLASMGHHSGEASALFTQLLDKTKTLLVDFSEHAGFDGKAIQSHSTGRTIYRNSKHKPVGPSDPDASWGVHKYYGVNGQGREKVTKKIDVAT